MRFELETTSGLDMEDIDRIKRDLEGFDVQVRIDEWPNNQDVVIFSVEIDDFDELETLILLMDGRGAYIVLGSHPGILINDDATITHNNVII